MPATIKAFDHRLGQLQDQLDRATRLEFYDGHFQGVDTDLNSISDLQSLPFTTTEMLLDDFEASPPLGSVYSDAVRQMNLTPAGDDLMPAFNTEYDVKRIGESLGTQFESQGIEEGDVVLQCLGYELFIGGWAMHFGLTAAGATVLPVGPGDSEQAAAMAQRFDADAIVANPSFGLKIAEQSDIEFDVFAGAGEPFTSVPGLREDVRDAFSGEPTIVDIFGLSEVIPVAAECRHENGLHVADDYVLVEVIDPTTEEPVNPGQRGEVVLTHLDKEAMPLIRYRTGDLATLVERDCPCGRSVTMPNGVFGRVDNQVKVKGVKFFPDVIRPVLMDFPALSGEFSVEISAKDKTDHLVVRCTSPNPNVVDTEALSEAITAELLITPNEIAVVEELETDDVIVDERY